MKFMKAMYCIWPDEHYIDLAIKAGINTLIFALIDSRPNPELTPIIDMMKKYKVEGKVKVIVMPTWNGGYVKIPDTHAFHDGTKFFNHTACPSSKYYPDLIMEYPISLVKKGICDGIFWDFEDYVVHHYPNDSFRYFVEWDKYIHQCKCKRCEGTSEKQQRITLGNIMREKYVKNNINITGEYPVSDPAIWKSLNGEKWWLDAYTYYDWNAYRHVLRYAKTNRKEIKIQNITCGIWMEQFKAWEILDWLEKCGKSPAADGYWLYPQMRMSKNNIWRLNPNTPYAKHSMNELRYTDYIDEPSSTGGDPFFFNRLKNINKNIDDYRESNRYFKFLNFIYKCFYR